MKITSNRLFRPIMVNNGENTQLDSGAIENEKNDRICLFAKTKHGDVSFYDVLPLTEQDIESGISPEKWNGRFRDMVFSVNFDKMTYAVGYISND